MAQKKMAQKKMAQKKMAQKKITLGQILKCTVDPSCRLGKAVRCWFTVRAPHKDHCKVAGYKWGLELFAFERHGAVVRRLS